MISRMPSLFDHKLIYLIRGDSISRHSAGSLSDYQHTRHPERESTGEVKPQLGHNIRRRRRFEKFGSRRACFCVVFIKIAQIVTYFGTFPQFLLLFSLLDISGVVK
jgi:hypothetical protein